MALNLLEQLPPQPRLSTAAIHAQAEAEREAGKQESTMQSACKNKYFTCPNTNFSTFWFLETSGKLRWLKLF